MSETDPEFLAAQALAELMLFYPEWLLMQELSNSVSARKAFFRICLEACNEHPIDNPIAQAHLIRTLTAYASSENAKEFMRMRKGIQGLN